MLFIECPAFFFFMKPYTPHEFKVMLVRECEPMSAIMDQPELVADYWRKNIPKADWFDPMKEALVVLVLNTRKRIIGHNLVALGSLDTCPVTPLFVFRPVLAVAGASIILTHNHPSGSSDPSEADIRVTDSRNAKRCRRKSRDDLTDRLAGDGRRNEDCGDAAGHGTEDIGGDDEITAQKLLGQTSDGQRTVGAGVNNRSREMPSEIQRIASARSHG
jgi:hypothetical protein